MCQKRFVYIIVAFTILSTFTCLANKSETDGYQLEVIARFYGLVKYRGLKQQNEYKQLSDATKNSISRFLESGRLDLHNEINNLLKCTKVSLGGDKNFKCDTFITNDKYHWLTKIKEDNEALFLKVKAFIDVSSKNETFKDPDINKFYFGIDKKGQDFYSSPKAFPDRKESLYLLFKYWNFIYYHYPKLESVQWEQELRSSIQRLLSSDSPGEIYILLSELSSSLDDCHAYFDSYFFDQLYGPIRSSGYDTRRQYIRVEQIDDKTVISRLREGFNTQNIQTGDILLGIDHLSINEIKANLLKFCGCSNQQSVIRNLNDAISKLPAFYNSDTVRLRVQKPTGEIKNITVDLKVMGKWEPRLYESGESSDSIGYVNLSMLKTRKELRQTLKRFKKEKGIIIDARGGGVALELFSVSIRLPYSTSKNPEMFNWYTPNASKLGCFQFKKQKSKIGIEKILRLFTSKIDVPVVILIGSYDQSSDEGSLQRMKLIHQIKLIGSKTAGSYGRASSYLIDDYTLTYYTCDLVNLPDETPFLGVNPDITVSQTIESHISKKDMVVEAAKNEIKMSVPPKRK